MWLGLQALNEDGCMLGAKIVWITLMETRSVRRWAACEYSVCWPHGTSVGTKCRSAVLLLLDDAATIFAPENTGPYTHLNSPAQAVGRNCAGGIRVRHMHTLSGCCRC